MGVRRIALVAAVPAAIIMPAVVAPSTVSNVAICPRGMAPNPAGYGCVPELSSNNNWPGGAFVGVPSQEVLTRCHGNYYICVWPYPVP